MAGGLGDAAILKVGGRLHTTRGAPGSELRSRACPCVVACSSVIQELLSSEQAFVGKLQFLQSHHIRHLDRCPHAPPAVASQKAVIFRNVQDISHFHSRWADGQAYSVHTGTQTRRGVFTHRHT